MAKKVKPIPEGYGTLTPYIVVNDAVARDRVLQARFRRYRSFPQQTRPMERSPTPR